MNTNQTKLTLFPGVEIIVSDPKLLTIQLIKRFGARPILQALEEAFEDKHAEPIAKPKAIEPVPELPKDLASLITVKNCGYSKCKQQFLGQPSKKYCNNKCAKKAWEEQNPDKMKAYQEDHRRKYSQKKLPTQQDHAEPLQEDEQQALSTQRLKQAINKLENLRTSSTNSHLR